VFLKVQASTARVNAVGSTIVDFHLAPGATISGRVSDATTSFRIDLIDLECNVGDPAYLGSANAAVPQHGAIRRSRAEHDGRIARLRAGGWSREFTGSSADGRPGRNLAIEPSVPSGSTPLPP
jgi:hypothetical protein